jgi:arylsulfatase
VLLITIDTLRADHLGTYGFAQNTSPRIDALARDSVVFERAIAASSATNPSHASIMTSRYPREHSIGHHNGASRLEGTATLATLFRESGFETAAFVGNLLLQRRTGFDRGFETYDDELRSAEVNRGAVLERTAEPTTVRALAWLEEQRSGPFFLWVHYQDPHGPYTAPEGWSGRIRVPGGPDEKPLPLLANDQGWGGIPSYQAQEGLNLLSQYRSRYGDEVHYADHWIGELIEALDDHASGRETVILLTADHGESFGENDRYLVHFFTTTPENAHVPLILRAPGLPPGRRPGVASHVDVMPTLLELAGIAPPPDARGLALGPFVREGRPLPDRSVYCDMGREMSVYHRDGFLRVLGADPGDPHPEATPYRWDEEGSWWRSDGDAGLDAPALEYVRRVPPAAAAPPMPSRLARELRALGYAE